MEILLELPIKVQNLKSNKRKEEKLKLVFNWAFPYIEDGLLRKHQLPTDPQDFFILYYFGSVPKSTAESIRAFLKPTSNYKAKNRTRNFNINFLYTISQSQVFMQDLVLALESAFFPEMEVVMYSKLIRTIKRWDEIIGQDSENGASIVREKLERSKKMKLPWPVWEVKNAKETVLSTLNNNTNKNKMNCMANFH